jgi:ABC-type Mn2+/Zn2+ transport system ATPase subunit
MSRPATTPAVEIRGLNVFLGGRHVLQDINLTLAAGQLVALIGPNGAGKTTLVRSMLGLIPVRSGTVRLLGEANLRAALPRVGYVPQRLALDVGLAMSVREFLALRRPSTRNWFWRRHADLDATLPPIVEELGVRRLLDKSVSALSGGQLQRVLIAFGLLDNPELLFLDEPTEGVDGPGERTFYEIISDVHRGHGLSVILVSHDLSMVHRHASWVVALNAKVCCEGSPDQIIREDALQAAYGLHLAPYHHHHSHAHGPFGSPASGSPDPSHSHPHSHSHSHAHPHPPHVH